MKRISLSSIFFLICASFSSLSKAFNYRSSPIQRCVSFTSSTKKYRCVQIPHLQPQVQEDNRYDSTLQSAPLENINEGDGENPSPLNLKVIIPVVTVLAVAAAAVGSGKFGTFDFTQIIEQSASKIEKMGPYGYLYFALVGEALYYVPMCSHSKPGASTFAILTENVDICRGNNISLLLYLIHPFCLCLLLQNFLTAGTNI